jgi:hypothetical protein
MPRSLLEILLEKKNPKKSLPYPTRDQYITELKYLEELCYTTLTNTFGTENFGGVNVSLFNKVRTGLEECQATLKKYREEYEDYPWEDPTVQDGLRAIRIKIKGDKPDEEGGFLLDLSKARIESLGEGDLYRIAITYFETAESLRVSGTQKILKIASIRYKEGIVDKSRANTDLTENNQVNAKKLDITAKKNPERVVGPRGKMTDDQWADYQKTIAEDNKKIEEANKKRKQEAIKLRMGIFDYLGTIILGESPENVKEKWGGEIDPNDNEPKDPNDNQKKYRIELLKKAMPFIEKVTERDFNNDDPFGDKDYMNFIMILASYSPGYKNYEPDPKEQEKEEKITTDQKKVIGEEMGKRKEEITKLIDQIKARHTGNGVINKIITDEMVKAQDDLNLVDPKTACDANSKLKLFRAKQDLADKVSKNADALDKEDIVDLKKVTEIIDSIFNYCSGKKYITEVKK